MYTLFINITRRTGCGEPIGKWSQSEESRLATPRAIERVSRPVSIYPATFTCVVNFSAKFIGFRDLQRGFPRYISLLFSVRHRDESWKHEKNNGKQRPPVKNNVSMIKSNLFIIL